jgi:cold shock CspA family protein
MPRSLKAKALTRISAAREGSTYQLQIEDEAGKKALFQLTSKQALQLADGLDNLLADEEEELGLKVPPPQPKLPIAAPEGFGVVKWYNTTKGFGFVTPDAGGEELFLHRSTPEQAGLSELQEGTRVRIQVTEGKKGPQVSTIALA